MSNDDIQRTLGRIEAKQETITNEINMLRTDVAEIKTNCTAQKCKTGPVVGAGVAGGGVVGVITAALLTWLQSKGVIP